LAGATPLQDCYRCSRVPKPLGVGARGGAGQTTINSTINPAINPETEAIPSAVQTSIDAIASSVETICQEGAALFDCAMGFPIQPPVDAVTLAVQSPVDTVAQSIQSRIMVLPAILLPMGGWDAAFEISPQGAFGSNRDSGIDFFCGRRLSAQYTQPRDDCQGEPVVGRHGSILPAREKA